MVCRCKLVEAARFSTLSVCKALASKASEAFDVLFILQARCRTLALDFYAAYACVMLEIPRDSAKQIQQSANRLCFQSWKGEQEKVCEQ